MTDADGLAQIPLEEPLFATVLRMSVSTRSVPSRGPRALTVQLEPGLGITVGSVEPEFDIADAGDLRVSFDYPEGSAGVVWFDGAFGDPVLRSGTGSDTVSLPVPAGALDEPADLLATEVGSDGDGGAETVAYALAPGLDLGPLAGGDAVEIALPAWRTDLDEMEVTVTGFDASEDLTIRGRLFEGDVVPGARNHRVFGDSRHPSQLEDPEVFAVRYPPALGDHLVVQAESSGSLSYWKRHVTAHLLGLPGAWDVDLAPQIPAIPSRPEGEFDVTVIKRAAWTNGDGAVADGILLRVSGGWDILLPAGATGWQFPLLPGEHAALSDNMYSVIEVMSIDGSAFDGYAGLIEAFVNRAIDAPPAGETVAVAYDKSG